MSAEDFEFDVGLAALAMVFTYMLLEGYITDVISAFGGIKILGVG